MAHARYPTHHTDSPFPKRSPLMAWSANQGPTAVHPDRLDGYSCITMDDSCCVGAGNTCTPYSTAEMSSRVLNSLHVAGVKRKCRDMPSDDCQSSWSEVEAEDTKRLCTREYPKLYVDSVPVHHHGDTVPRPITEHPIPMDTVSSTSKYCTNFRHRKLQLYTLSEAGAMCHHSHLGLNIIDCSRCLAGEGGHLEHIQRPIDQSMDTHS